MNIPSAFRSVPGEESTGASAQGLLEQRTATSAAHLHAQNRALLEEIAACKKSEQEARRASRAKSMFLADMSHEIRTPLNAVLGYVQILARKKGLPADVQPALTAMAESGHHLLRLIEGILDLSKIEAGKMEVQPVDFDLGALLRSVHAICQQRAEQKGLRLIVETLGNLPVWVRGDQGKLRQVLLNLLGNAVKFTPSGDVRLRVVPGEHEDVYRFEVIDHGPGLSSELHDRIFEKFQQTAEGVHQGGAGLGLSISRKLIELLGGRLVLNSQPAWGSNFHFQLHLPQVAGTLTTKARDEEVHQRLARGHAVRALVIDDRKVNRDLLRQMLREVGCHVKTAACSEDAQELLAKYSPKVVFIDARLPGMDSAAAVELLRDRCRNRPKLVCYSAAAFEHEWQRYRAAGFDAFLPKPLSYERLRECLSTLLAARFEVSTTEPEEPGRIPPATAKALWRAAEIGDFAEIRKALDELDESGKGPFFQRLRAYADSFNMAGLQAVLRSAADVETPEIAA